MNRKDFWLAWWTTGGCLIVGEFTIGHGLPGWFWPWVLIPVFWVFYIGLGLYRRTRNRP